MAQKVTGPRGTQDVSPYESYKWLRLENKLRSIVGQYGFKEIRVPTFEHTELFLRGVGDTTDIVNKEMYTFEDKGKRSITLRPEGTSPTVRSVLEKGILNEGTPLKAYYILSCFRYENLRQVVSENSISWVLNCLGHRITPQMQRLLQQVQKC